MDTTVHDVCVSDSAIFSLYVHKSAHNERVKSEIEDEIQNTTSVSQWFNKSTLQHPEREESVSNIAFTADSAFHLLGTLHDCFVAGKIWIATNESTFFQNNSTFQRNGVRLKTH